MIDIRSRTGAAAADRSQLPSVVSGGGLVGGSARRTGFLFSCTLTFCISVVATIYFCCSMSGGMKMPGGWTMSMMWMPMPGQTWLTSAVMFLLMWLAMMVAMMLPSAVPMLDSYRQSGTREGGARVSTFIVAAGYFAVWMAIGSVVYVLGVTGANATMRFSSLSRWMPVVTGAMLIFSALMQFSHWKMAALKRCRNTAACISVQSAGGQKKSWRRGLNEGVTCAICCSGPMLAMLALGAMNPVAMVVVALVISLEKLSPKPQLIARFSGGAGLLFGVLKIMRAILLPA